jgi:hypothetical protein
MIYEKLCKTEEPKRSSNLRENWNCSMLSLKSLFGFKVLPEKGQWV